MRSHASRPGLDSHRDAGCRGSRPHRASRLSSPPARWRNTLLPITLRVLWAFSTLVSALLAAPAAAQSIGEGARRVEWSVPAATFTSAPLASAPRPKGWEVIVTPYLWAAGLHGEVGSRGRTVEVDIGFSDLIKKLDGALFLPIELRKERWGLISELILIKLSNQSATPGPLFGGVELSADQTLVQLLPYYRIIPQDPVALDVLLGGRLWQLGATLDFSRGILPGILVEATERWIDPVIGTRIVARLGKRWQIFGYGDLGGFGVGSRFTWQLLGSAGYQLSEGVALRLGYRQLHVNFHNEDDGFVFDTGTGGWLLGVGIRL